MTYPLLYSLIGKGILVWLFLLALVVVSKVLRHPRIISDLCAAEPGDKNNRPERLMHLGGVMGAPVIYLLQVLRARAESAVPLEQLPEVPDGLLVFFAGTTTLYLSGKILRTEDPKKGGS